MRREPTQGERLRKTLVLDVREANDTDRTILHTITQRLVDRDGDVIEPRGARLENFQKNPIVLFGHDSWAFPVGKNVALEIGEYAITALTQFAGDAQAHPQAETAYRLARDGFLKAWSIGFMPITWSEDKALPGQDGWWFKEWELYEYSLVPIPSNPEALSRMAKAYGLPPGATERDLAAALCVTRTPFWDVAGSIAAAQVPVEASLVSRLEAAVTRLEKAGRGGPDQAHDDAISADVFRAAMWDAVEQCEGARGAQ